MNVSNIIYIRGRRPLLRICLTISLLVSSAGQGYALRPAATVNSPNGVLSPQAAALQRLKSELKAKLPQPISDQFEARTYFPQAVERFLRGDKQVKYELAHFILGFTNSSAIREAVVQIFIALAEKEDSNLLPELYKEFVSLYKELLTIDASMAIAVSLGLSEGLEYLSRRGFHTAADCLEGLFKEDRHGYSGSNALIMLAYIGRHVEEAFSHDSARVRLSSLRFFIRGNENDSGYSILTNILQEKNELAKVYACWGLGMMGKKEALKLLKTEYFNTSNSSLRRACVWAVRNIGFAPNKMGMQSPPIYDIKNPGEVMDFDNFKPAMARKGDGANFDDISRNAQAKMALYPYLSAVYLVRVDGELAKGSKTKELAGKVPDDEIVDKISFMAVSRNDAEDFYKNGHTVKVMFQLSRDHKRAVVDVDEYGNWYQLKGADLVNNAISGVTPLWIRPKFTSNTDSGLADTNQNFVKRLGNDPLAIEEQGGDISKFLAACRFKTMVTPGGKGFMSAPRWRLKSDDEDNPDQKPIFVPGTHLIFLGKEPRRTSDILDLAIPDELRVDWILSELGFLDLSKSLTGAEGIEHIFAQFNKRIGLSRETFNSLTAYFEWFGIKLGREIAAVINSGRSHYFLQHMHNTTLSGKLVDFESIQRHERIEKTDILKFVRRDMDHVQIMISGVFSYLFRELAEDIEKISVSAAGMIKCEVILLTENVKAEFLKAVRENVDKRKSWLLKRIGVIGAGLPVSIAEINGYGEPVDLSPCLGMRLGRTMYILKKEILDFLESKAGPLRSGGSKTLANMQRRLLSRKDYGGFLKNLKKLNPWLHGELLKLGDDARRQINSILAQNEDATQTLCDAEILQTKDRVIDYSDLPFADILNTLQRGDERRAMLEAGFYHIMSKKGILDIFCNLCGMSKEEKTAFSADILQGAYNWMQFWTTVFICDRQLLFSQFGAAIRILRLTDPFIRRVVDIYNHVRDEAEEKAPEYTERIKGYINMRLEEPDLFRIMSAVETPDGAAAQLLEKNSILAQIETSA